MSREPSTSPSRWLLLVWWVLRLAVLAALPWMLWMLLPPPVTVTVSVALCALSLAFLSPWDLPWRPLRAPGQLVMMWDLTLLLLGVACAIMLLPAVSYLLVLLLAALAALCRFGIWTRTRGETGASQGSSEEERGEEAGGEREGDQPTEAPPALAPLIAGACVLAVLIPAFAATSGPRVWGLLACVQLRATPGESELRAHADVETPDVPANDLTGPALWHTDDPGRLVGGHNGTVTLADEKGFAVRSSAQGRLLWHVDAEHSSYSPTADDVGQVHQIGDTVLVEYRSPSRDGAPYTSSQLIAYEAATGRRTWCEKGPRQVLTAPEESDRFVARVGVPGSDWGLFDAGDGSLVAPLALEGRHRDAPLEQGRTDRDDLQRPQVRAHFGEGRVTVWSDRALASYDAATGDLVTEITGLRPRALGLVHSGDLTVVSSSWLNEEAQTVAYGPDGTELWLSSGRGYIAACSVLRPVRALDGHVLIRENNPEGFTWTAVGASDGTVAWVSEDHRSSCAEEWYTVGERLVSRSGVVIGPESPQGPFAGQGRPVQVTATANGVGVSGFGSDSPALTFHALP